MNATATEILSVRSSDSIEAAAAGEGKQPAPRRKLSAEQRIRALIAELKVAHQRIVELERETGHAEQDKAELARLRADHQERERRLKEIPERIAKARERGRKLFADFDAVITGAPVDPEAFQALLASTNGPELMYAAGLGFKAMALYREFQTQAESEQQQIAYYRELNRQHFAGVKNG